MNSSLILFRIIQVIMLSIICYFIISAIRGRMSIPSLIVFSINAIAIILACEVVIRKYKKAKK